MRRARRLKDVSNGSHWYEWTGTWDGQFGCWIVGSMAVEVRGQLMSSKMLRAFPRQSTGAAETVAASANGIRKLVNCMVDSWFLRLVGKKLMVKKY